MLTAKLILERLDKDGRLLERREQPCRSFIKAFIQLLYVAHKQIEYSSPYSITDIDGTPRDVDSEGSGVWHDSKATLAIAAPPGLVGVNYLSYSANGGRWNCIVQGEKVGIQVGTGTNAVTPTDNALQTRIAHGRGSGELEYGGCELIGILFSGLSPHDGEFTIRRYFTNVGGGSITINELGIHAIGVQNGTSSYEGYAWAFLIARDTVSPGVEVTNGQILRATYVPQITT